jgi:hypothetical protein
VREGEGVKMLSRVLGGTSGDMGDPLSIYGFLSLRGAAFPISSRFHDFKKFQLDQARWLDRGLRVWPCCRAGMIRSETVFRLRQT